MTWHAVDTWGVSGSTFLAACLITFLIALTGSVLWWRWAVARPLGRTDGDLEPIEVAYVSGGPRLALHSDATPQRRSAGRRAARGSGVGLGEAPTSSRPPRRGLGRTELRPA